MTYAHHTSHHTPGAHSHHRGSGPGAYLLFSTDSRITMASLPLNDSQSLEQLSHSQKWRQKAWNQRRSKFCIKESLIIEAQTGKFWQQTVAWRSKRENSFLPEDVWYSGSLWHVFPSAVSRGRKLIMGDNGRCGGQTGTDQEHVGMWTFH